MKETELRKHATCFLCKEKIGHTGLPLFWRVKIERFALNIEAMKRQPGEAIMIFGSGSIVRQLTEHRLIDDYWFVITPTVLGEGQPLFHDVPVQTPLTLCECKAYQTGNVLLKYAPKA